MFGRNIKNIKAVSFGLSLAAADCAHAQARPSSTGASDDCRDRDWGGGDRVYCETREISVPLAKSLRVDGRQNGSVRVHGWDKNEIHATAHVEAHARDDRDAQDLAKQVTISTPH